MNPQTLINELMEIEAWAAGLQEKCYKTRKSLERLNAPAPRKGKRNGLSQEEIAKLLARRNKTILKRTSKS